MSARAWGHPLHTIARALSVDESGPYDCPMCGDSPFGPGSKVGQNFCDVQLLRGPGAVCAGCSRIMGGRPGSEPPPLRTVSFAVWGRSLVTLSRADLWRALWVDPAPCVVSWARSRKKHHSLHAGPCDGVVLRVGGDDGTILLDREQHLELANAVVGLLGSPTGVAPILSRDSIRTGDYSAPAVARFGAAEWERLDRVVSNYRPGSLLDLLTDCAPLGPAPKESLPVIDPHDERASWVLARLAASSEARRGDGLTFWRGFFRHRLERARRMPLPDLVSRLTDALRCDVLSDDYRAALEWLSGASAEEAAPVAASIRARPAYLVAIAFDQLKRERTEREQKETG